MRYFILLICLFLLVMPIFAQENEPTSILEIHYALKTVDDLEARGILSPEAAETERAYYLAAAENLTGEALSREEISERAFEPAGGLFRFLSFINIIWALASLIIAISSIWLFIIYVVPLIKRVPLFIYEILAYCAAFAFIWYGQYAEAGVRQYVALPGVLVLGFLLPFSYVWRVKDKSFGEIFHRNALVLLFLTLSLIWGFVAVQYESELIAFLTILSGLLTLTFTRWVKMLLQPFGYTKEEPLIEIMVMCFGLMLLYLLAETRGIMGAYQVFGLGVYWIGTYGYFGALEIKSSKWRNKTYLNWQILALLSALLGLYVGINWQIESMSETAGTFLLIYTLTKYIEIPNWRRHWAWASLGLGVLLYSFAWLINQFPQFFLLG